MVLSEVARDPPSPFLTVQSSCDGIVLPVVPPPVDLSPSPASTNGRCSNSKPRHCVPCNGALGGSRRAGDAARCGLQSIVSQQSLSFNAPPDSPLEFELNSITGGAGEPTKPQHMAAAVPADGNRVNCNGSAQMQYSADMASKPKGLRFLQLNHSWLRSTRSMPHYDQGHRTHSILSPRNRQHMLQELPSTDPGSMQDQQQLQQASPVLGRRLKCKVSKLLSWASSRHPQPSASVPSSPPVQPMPLLANGSLNISHPQLQHLQQQQQQLPQPWQQAVFSEGPVQLINTCPGTPPPLRSPRTSLVSSPSSCDCPPLLGRFSSTGSDATLVSSPGPIGAGSSLSTTPSPRRAAAAGGIAVAGGSVHGSSSGGAAPLGDACAPLQMTGSVRQPHHRHRQHRPGCRHYQEQQQQQYGQQQQLQQQASQSPNTSGGGLAPQSSLRAALQQLESMASLKAARIMDKLNAGLQRMASHRVFDCIDVALRGCKVGKEVMRDWEFGPQLGAGASCVLRLVTERSTGRPAACKSISKHGILRSTAVKVALLSVQREVAILQATAGHPHIVQLHAVYEDVHNLHMIMEWCVGGSLLTIMSNCPGFKLPEAAAAAATKVALEVLAHCHAKGVMHRDIKPENLLISQPLEAAQQLTADLVKVTDFGISLPFTPGQVLTELAGTPGYMAPEVLQRAYAQQADVWSTGVMLYEMITGQLPFGCGDTIEECLAAIEDSQLDFDAPEWQAVSEDARELVKAMLTKDPYLRPSAQKLLEAYSNWLDMGSRKQQ